MLLNGPENVCVDVVCQVDVVDAVGQLVDELLGQLEVAVARVVLDQEPVDVSLAHRHVDVIHLNISPLHLTCH